MPCHGVRGLALTRGVLIRAARTVAGGRASCRHPSPARWGTRPRSPGTGGARLRGPSTGSAAAVGWIRRAAWRRVPARLLRLVGRGGATTRGACSAPAPGVLGSARPTDPDGVAGPDRRGDRGAPVVEALPLPGGQAPSRSSHTDDYQRDGVDGHQQAGRERSPQRLAPASACCTGYCGDPQHEEQKHRPDQRQRSQCAHAVSIVVDPVHGNEPARTGWAREREACQRT